MLSAGGLSAQQRIALANDATVHRGVDGIALATLPAGATVRTSKTSGTWSEVTLEGWITAASLGRTDREGFNRIVTAPDGENLRDSPNGQLVARMRKGVLLAKLGERAGWVHVRRTGWVHRPRTAVAAGPAAKPAPKPAAPKPTAGPVETGAVPPQGPAAAAPKPKPVQQPAAPGKTSAKAPAKSAATPQAPQPSVPGNVPIEVAHSAPLFAQPGGGQLADLAAGASGRVLSQSGEWVRVQFEGWVRESDLKPGTGAALVGVTAAEVRANPDRYVGQTVEWRTQFISIQKPDPLRSELLEGQPFLLTRGPLPEPGFVYVIVGNNQLEQFRAVPALQELTLRVTIRAPRTKYLATPVVELVSVVSGMPGQ